VSRVRLQAILDSVAKSTLALAHAETMAVAAAEAFADRISAFVVLWLFVAIVYRSGMPLIDLLCTRSCVV
jgi:hypothetical protein